MYWGETFRPVPDEDIIDKHGKEHAKGGVHICKLAYGDLTWENSSDPESYAPWYTMIMGLHI